MIHKLYANNSKFKSVKFKAGLNLILADRQQSSTDKDSRNGLGKTSLLNVLHFCLGANLQKKLLPVEQIEDWVFYLEIALNAENFKVSRTIENPGIVSIEGNVTVLPILPETDEDTGALFYKVAAWNQVLGHCLFAIPSTTREKYKPSFRDLISYFIRSGKDAYSEPFSYRRNQKSWQCQIANSFLIGLNWEQAARVQDLKDNASAVSSLGNAIELGIISSKGELEAERLRLEPIVEKEQEVISTFRVHPQYQEIQDTADELTKLLHELANHNFSLKNKNRRYEESIESENPPQESDLTKLYDEAGMIFSETIIKTLKDTKAFHSSIVKNRDHFLRAELEGIRAQINSNDTEIERLSVERAGSLSLLETHGALEEFSKLQERLAEKKSKLETVRRHIEEIRDMSSKKKEIKAQRVELDTMIQRDFEEARPHWEQAVTGFNENSLALYNEPGDLIINISEKGVVKENAFKFDVQIPRSNSEGVSKMKIFCYDLMLVDIFSRRKNINFLVHDSTMYDAVDSRQRAHALEHAHEKAIESGFQYICAFNSDMLPMGDFSDDFNIKDYIRLTLSDKDPKDSLFGFRFDDLG